MELLEKLNQSQKQAVTHKEGPLLIVAGAGTGKTTVITSRMAWLINEGLAKPDEILALTFTEKASAEMEERVDLLLPYGYVDLWISTFHAFCERILKQHGLDIGLPNDFKLLDSTAQWLLVRQNLDKFNLDYYRPLGNPTKFIHALLKHFSRCKDEEISATDYLKYAENLRLDLDNGDEKLQITNYKLQKTEAEIDISEVNRLSEIANAYHVYQQLLLDNSALDFGDLVNYTLKLFRERPAILKKYQEQFKYILVDEFQDTNWAQYELVKLLLNEKQNLTVVGDDDQSIYKFRGASVSNILNFLKDFSQAKQVVLNENYRSSQEILDLSYDFIQLNNPNRLECVDNNVGASPRGCPVDASTGQAQGTAPTNFCINKKLKSHSENPAQIEHLHGVDLAEEISLVINKIVELKNNDVQTGLKPVSTWSDFVILARANDTLSPFVAELARLEIPYVFYSLRGLYSKQVVMDALALFKLLDNYHESTAVYRALNIPTFRINYKDFVTLSHQAQKKSESLYSVLQKIDLFKNIEDQTRDRVKKLISLIDKYSPLAKTKKVSEIYTGLFQDSGYLKYLASTDNQESRQQLGYLQQFYQKIKDFENDVVKNSAMQNMAPLKNFLQEIEMEIDAGEEGAIKLDLDVGPEMVKVMTIHSAKGLEFKYVFVVGMVDKRFPTIERKDPIQVPDALVKEILPTGDAHLEEERRLFYVAMTRAKLGLFFSSAADYGGAREKKVSRFLVEAGYNTKHGTRNMEHKIEIAKTDKTPQPPLSGGLVRVSDQSDKDELMLIDGSTPPTPPARGGVVIPSDDKITLVGNSESPPDKGGWGVSDDGSNLKVENSNKEVYPIPKHFSFSQLAAFNTCPLQYKYRFLLKIPVHGKGVFSFGKTMHSALQKFFQKFLDGQVKKQTSLFDRELANFTPPSLDDLLKFYEESWIDEWYENAKDKKEYHEKGKKILKDFYQQTQGNWPKIKFLEKGFSLKIGGYTVRGVIDRLDELNGGVEIVDYKTGSVKNEGKLTSDDKAQLLLYQIAVEEVFQIKPEKLTFYYLDENKPVSFIGKEEEKIKLKAKILDQIQQIKNSDFAPTPSMMCKYCDFFSICDYREMF